MSTDTRAAAQIGLPDGFRVDTVKHEAPVGWGY